MKRQEYGFTLIEIMVVVVIAAILMGAVTISFPRSGDDLLKEDAERFSALVALLEDEAILQSRDMAIAINDSGYEFYQRIGDVWDKYSSRPFVFRELRGGTLPDLFIEGVPIQLKKRAETKPQIVVYSSGEITPFVYMLSNANKSTVEVVVDAAGTIKQVYKNNDE